MRGAGNADRPDDLTGSVENGRGDTSEPVQPLFVVERDLPFADFLELLAEDILIRDRILGDTGQAVSVDDTIATVGRGGVPE